MKNKPVKTAAPRKRPTQCRCGRRFGSFRELAQHRSITRHI